MNHIEVIDKLKEFNKEADIFIQTEKEETQQEEFDFYKEIMNCGGLLETGIKVRDLIYTLQSIEGESKPVVLNSTYGKYEINGIEGNSENIILHAVKNEV